jgi:molybdopterin/thiamine biosynthesis adenylyltransferase
MYFDATELYQAPLTPPNEDRLKSLFTCLGSKKTEYITGANIFMVGAGAIGCELLKNFAMLSLGTKGKITLTDPDFIEVSNLTRQFLFREKHLRKPKSGTAAAAVIQMNDNLKGHIDARLDKLHDETSSTYSEAFFAS